MLTHHEAFSGRTLELFAAAEAAARQVPPAFPLEATVAVNPFLGQADEALAIASARLERTSGARIAPPRQVVLERMEAGEIEDDDLAAAIAAAGHPIGSASALRSAAARPSPDVTPLRTVADLAASVSGIDWPEIVSERIGHWAASHFDRGQALWPVAPLGAYASWRAFATRDLTPEIQGLAGFCASVAAAPQVSRLALAEAATALEVTSQAAETLFHRLLMTLGGWAQLARGRGWQAEHEGERDTTLTDLLSIRLMWEAELFRRYEQQLREKWHEVLAEYAAPLRPSEDAGIDLLLLGAADRAAQRRLSQRLTETSVAARPATRVQAAFCIDVRSEPFRRALETVDPEIDTIGFAGFFGLASRHTAFASDVEELRCPPLIAPGLSSTAQGQSVADGRARIFRRTRRAWGRFKLAAVSSFAFVEAAGPIYVTKLVRDALGLADPVEDEPAPRLRHDLDVASRTDIAQQVLRAMSLADGFAALVLLVGHGAHVANNPHASALQCGACGGHAGDVNARLLANLLNDSGVRAELETRGIAVPLATTFVAALHDTTSDEVKVFDADLPRPLPNAELKRVRDALASAGRLVRLKRSATLRGQDPLKRARDWAEIRPEWGLAGCHGFVAAPRHRTAGRDLHGIFLHEYDWKQDQRLATLELILTAPVVVASWISLQYLGSSVSPAVFGAGNKLLHNVTGGIGVVEGNAGILRAGLPWQSVSDGERLVHEPLRLSVVLDAPREAISAVLDLHPEVRALFDNGWLHLFAMGENGALEWRYDAGAWKAERRPVDLDVAA